MYINSTNSCDPFDYIIESTNDEIFEKPADYTKIKSVLKQFDVGKVNKKSFDTDMKLARFGMIQDTKKENLLVFLVMNHVICDGATLYTIWKQLDTKNEVTSLKAERCLSFPIDVAKVTSLLPKNTTNEQNVGLFVKSWFPAVMMKGIAQTIKRCKFKQFLVNFDMNEIKKEKSKYNTADFFVSTNDVITAWTKKLVPKLDNMMFLVNCRNRVPGVQMNMAGNYLMLPIIKSRDMENAGAVRTWLNKVMKPGFDWEFPSYKEWRKCVGGVNTSWTGFYHHLDLEGFEHVMHFPVEIDLETELGPAWFGKELNIISFFSNPGQVSCLVYTRRKDVTFELMEATEMLKGKLMNVN